MINVDKTKLGSTKLSLVGGVAHVCVARDGRRPGPRKFSWRGHQSTINYPCADRNCPHRAEGLRRPETPLRLAVNF